MVTCFKYQKGGENLLNEKTLVLFTTFLLFLFIFIVCVLGYWGAIGLMLILYQFALAMCIGLAIAVPCLLIWNLMVSRFGYEKTCIILSIILLLMAMVFVSVTISILI